MVMSLGEFNKILDETGKGSFLWLLILLGYILGNGFSWSLRNLYVKMAPFFVVTWELGLLFHRDDKFFDPDCNVAWTVQE
ncbi:hypothetical protein HAX54_031972 [Datura stramonium]|uniref:Uncharacterized protein n=1 Tax=Datura stramonium TaxID=4076 RepID=A0ABS8VBA4_DATST|nr:hypothetical protein [Datura stramonium]